MFTEVLALCNSTLALMIMLCSFCRSFTQKIIRKDIFFTLLQNMFTKTYINMLKNCNIQQQNEEIQEKDMAQGSQIQKIQSANQEGEEVDKTQSEEKMETESKNDISIPQFQSKFSQQLTHDLVSQKIGPHIKENKEDIVKLSNIYKQSNREEVEFKKYDNLHDLTLDESLQMLNEKQLSLQLEDQLFSTKIFKRKSQLENKGVKKQMLKKIEQQIDDSLDFFKFFKEILFLKKAALILLSKEQLAAIQLVGLDINDIQSKSEGDCMNHLKEQYEILQSTELCQDTDHIKRFVPNNCEEEQKINDFINHSNYFLNVKIKTSQFNTTQQEIQDQYRSQLSISTTSFTQITDFKIQNQITSVKKGLFIQSEQTFTSPISYTTQTLNYNRQQLIQDSGSQFLSYVYFEIDENITYFHIQYPMFTEILALCNSTLALMILICSFCRQFSKKIIRKDIFFTLLQNMFTKTYINLLKKSNINQQNQQIQEKELDQDQQIEKIRSEKQQGEGEADEQQDEDSNNEEKNETESKNDILIPQFQSKFSQQLINNLKSQKIGQKIQQNKEDNIKLSNYQIQPNSEEIEIKKQENISDITYQQSLNFQNSSYQDQTPNLIRFDSYQKQSQFYQLDVKENSIQVNSSTFKQNKIKQKIIGQPNKFSFKQRQNISMLASNQQVDESLQMLNEKKLSLQLEEELFSTKILKRRAMFENKGLNKQILTKIEQKIDDSLDYFKILKEILFLKKAALVLLSKEQLAAIQLVGLDIEDIEPKNHKIVNGEYYCMNHIKEQFEILQSTELQSQYIKLFLKKCQNELAIDPIDKRILSSLIINNEN
ncbi:hypothetical protein TTHERM_00328670 (macronuclear) [Tetrahymena thermophila SB210]|uniref:AMP-binding enzyme family protein n=1 Tax=Tetrahymena thermophila (strain SB210) TaxID=312017 RepID=I7LXV8_TETTS|nr:hypothetical protein TTHERM_00328670 [Tetrahymena thermophila SB210]EAS06286.2 hypothetical protein TTHERM_00328670 [Tetrahymena thermophila SB210]|eukprot:XP_001026531.2 hypothetical protein TTHERM_00328670 [Tetrahymena thermophila SB210]